MSALGEIQPIDRRGIEPVEAGPPPQIRWLPLAVLRVDHSYQRRIGERSVTLIRKIAAGWDWRRVKPLSVADLGDGTFEVIDGQHTAVAAATHGGIGELPAIVSEIASVEDRARTFVHLNRDRLAASPLHQFWAAAVAGDPVAAAVIEGAERTEAEVLRAQPAANGWGVGQTVAVRALMVVAAEKGKAGVARVLRIAVAAGLAPIKAVHIRALQALLWLPEFAGEIEDERIADVVAEIGGENLEEAARQARRETGQAAHREMAIAIYRRCAR